MISTRSRISESGWYVSSLCDQIGTMYLLSQNTIQDVIQVSLTVNQKPSNAWTTFRFQNLKKTTSHRDNTSILPNSCAKCKTNKGNTYKWYKGIPTPSVSGSRSVRLDSIEIHCDILKWRGVDFQASQCNSIASNLMLTLLLMLGVFKPSHSQHGRSLKS